MDREIKNSGNLLVAESPFPLPHWIEMCIALDPLDKLMLYMDYYVENYKNSDRISFDEFCSDKNFLWEDCGEDWESRGRAARYEQQERNLFHWYQKYNWAFGIPPKILSSKPKMNIPLEIRLLENKSYSNRKPIYIAVKDSVNIEGLTTDMYYADGAKQMYGDTFASYQVGFASYEKSKIPQQPAKMHTRKGLINKESVSLMYIGNAELSIGNWLNLYRIENR